MCSLFRLVAASSPHYQGRRMDESDEENQKTNNPILRGSTGSDDEEKGRLGGGDKAGPPLLKKKKRRLMLSRRSLIPKEREEGKAGDEGKRGEVSEKNTFFLNSQGRGGDGGLSNWGNLNQVTSLLLEISWDKQIDGCIASCIIFQTIYHD